MTASPLSYDIVMATRNRPEAVALSLPLLLAQTRAPRRILIVDSSEDAAPIAALAAAADGRGGIPVTYLRGPKGLTLQRNVGLRVSTSEVVIFPDDDSLLYPDAAERMMAVYEADAAGRIAAVCANAAPAAPSAATALDTVAAERITPLRLGLRRVRQAIKDRLGAVNPFLAVGNRLNAAHPLPDLPGAGPIVAVPYMTGFRMSFRRAVIAGPGFDEALRDYAWFEDIEASFTAMAAGAVVCALGARIYHHRFAGSRAGGEKMGRWAILNRGYVVMKHVDAHPQVFVRRDRERRRLALYCAARAWAYRVLARDGWARDRARGARAGLAELDGLTAARGPALVARYTALAQG